MIRETVDAQRAEVQKWLPILKATLGLSQNDVARYCGVHPSVFSRWLRGVLTSEPCAKAVARALPRLKRRVVVGREKVS